MLSRTREAVQQRHQEIQRLRHKPRFTLGAIAVEVGLKDHTSVLYHLNGACRCNTVKSFPLFVKQMRCAHDWKCTKCGTHG